MEQYRVSNSGVVNFLRALYVDLQRSILSIRFLLAVGLMLFWLVISGATYIFIYRQLFQSGIPYIFERAMTGSHSLGMIVLAMTTVPYSTSYLMDCESGFAYYAANRTGTFAYAIARVFSVGGAAFLAMVTAAAIFLMGLCITGAPLDTIPGNGTYFNGVYTDLVLQISPWCYFFVRFMISGLTAAMAAVFALYISSLIPNYYVTLLSPLILYYGWDAIISIIYTLSGGTLKFVKYFAMINNITFQVTSDNSFSFLWTTIFLLTLTLLWGRGFAIQFRREQGL